METKVCFTLALVLSMAGTSHTFLKEGGVKFHEGPQHMPKEGLSGQLTEELDIEDLGSSEVKENLLALTLQNLFQRPHRYRPLLYQPQRFGREARGGLRPQFWSMMTPQRFGKK